MREEVSTFFAPVNLGLCVSTKSVVVLLKLPEPTRIFAITSASPMTTKIANNKSNCANIVWNIIEVVSVMSTKPLKNNSIPKNMINVPLRLSILFESNLYCLNQKMDKHLKGLSQAPSI